MRAVDRMGLWMGHHGIDRSLIMVSGFLAYQLRRKGPTAPTVDAGRLGTTGVHVVARAEEQAGTRRGGALNSALHPDG